MFGKATSQTQALNLAKKRRPVWLYLPFKASNLISDAAYLKVKFKDRLGYKLNLNNPQTFNEKIQWLKLYDRRPIYTLATDKYKVRDYLTKMVGAKYLVPLLGVWNNFNEIDFSQLPNQFVLKCNHDSGSYIICEDKANFNVAAAKSKLTKALLRNYYYAGREWAYKNIEPKIMAESYLSEPKGELIDYKFMCFGGEVKCVFVCQNRRSRAGLNINIYDANWRQLPFGRKAHPASLASLNQPHNFKLMLEISRKISADFPFLRVDFYEIEEKIYISELTLYPSAGLEGFEPHNYDRILGDWLVLPSKTTPFKNNLNKL